MDSFYRLLEYRLPYIFYDLNILSVGFRLLLAMMLGGAIGLERGSNNHTAGFRTHILVCMGAALAMLTDQFICATISDTADPARLGAQVITGVGFLGAGSIFATGKHQIKGLTTAAGLWASAAVGLAVGIGFYSGAILGTIFIFVSLALLPRIESKLLYNARVLNIYVELDSIHSYNKLLDVLKNKFDLQIYNSHVSSAEPISNAEIGFHISIRLKKNQDKNQVIEKIRSCKEIILMDEL